MNLLIKLFAYITFTLIRYLTLQGTIKETRQVQIQQIIQECLIWNLNYYDVIIELIFFRSNGIIIPKQSKKQNENFLNFCIKSLKKEIPASIYNPFKGKVISIIKCHFFGDTIGILNIFLNQNGQHFKICYLFSLYCIIDSLKHDCSCIVFTKNISPHARY